MQGSVSLASGLSVLARPAIPQAIASRLTAFSGSDGGEVLSNTEKYVRGPLFPALTGLLPRSMWAELQKRFM